MNIGIVTFLEGDPGAGPSRRPGEAASWPLKGGNQVMILVGVPDDLLEDQLEEDALLGVQHEITSHMSSLYWQNQWNLSKVSVFSLLVSTFAPVWGSLTGVT